ncbi:hypothetical protein QNH39_07045 [Neobacillus novalis]|uniref:Uncharacterized protein n=1 Tax=Neobacillus novalis TaxID=220687 RepID=A0AA95MTN3_9BACI|nr:hypothetical protein [Neobacillus novalis]WHY87578.1 hypothetical protein QNH39_07045 [Neobacillus novalis]
MRREYIATELCEHELGGIKEATFRRNKKKYLANLRIDNHIDFGKRGRATTYILDSKKKELTEHEKANVEFLEILGCDIGDKDTELLKFILKFILEQDIVPVHAEITHHGNLAGIMKTRGTIGNYVGFLKENNIIAEPMQIPVWIVNPITKRDGTEIYLKRKYDPQTGEVLPTYYQRVVNHIYFDYAKNGIGAHRQRVSKMTHKAIEIAFNNLWPEVLENKIYPLYNQNHKHEYIEAERMKAQSFLIREIGKAFGIYYCVKIEEPIIQPSIKRQLEDYFKQQDNIACVY